MSAFTHPDRADTPKRAMPLYSFPRYSIVGGFIKGFLRLVSQISKTLRITSDTDKGVLRLTSDTNKGSLRLTSKVSVN